MDYKGQTFVLDYVIDANGEELDKGTISNFTADKISCYAEFETLPTVAPEQSDFTLQRKINDGAFEEVEIKSYSFDRTAKKASFGYSAVPTTDEPQNVTVKLTYDGKDYEASYEVVKGQGTIYYVDSENGNDTNNGTSEGTAFQTIEKINSIEFQPGDQILFKCGGTWTGALMPKGSGEEGNPITIGSYGEGPKPVLMPGEDWTDDSYIPNYINKANTVISNVVTNNVITFYNQEHWVVKDLELYDPRGEAEGFDPSRYYNRKYYYRAILMGAKDVGDLYGFTFDNLTIHGFRGDNSLNDLIAKASVIEKGEYTTASYYYLQTALKNAQAAVDKDITVRECEVLENALQEAIDGLKVNGEYSKVTGLTATAPSEENAGTDGPASWAVDGNSNTIWHTAYSAGKVQPVNSEDGENNYITIDMGELKNVYKLEYLPRQAGQNNGIIRKYVISYSTTADGDDFVEIASGSWAEDTTLKSAEFAPVDARRIRLTATSTAGVGGEDTYITAAEIMLYEFVKPETPEVDKTAIEEQLNRYNGLNKANYTEESWNAMEAVLAETKTVFENVLATEEQAAQAAENLRNAIDSLEKVSGYEVGDVDHSGLIDIDDATAIQCHLVKKAPVGTFDDSLADVNNDGHITIADSTCIQIMLMSN